MLRLFGKPPPDAQAVLPEAHESLISPETVAEVPSTGLSFEHAIEKPTQRLEAFVTLDSDGFVAEVRTIQGRKSPLSAAVVKHLRDESARSVEPAQTPAREAVEAKHTVSDLVNAAYGLTPDEIDLTWAIAPPRVPIARRSAGCG